MASVNRMLFIVLGQRKADTNEIAAQRRACRFRNAYWSAIHLPVAIDSWFRTSALTCAEYFVARVASGGEHRVVARAAEDFIAFRAELLVDQRHVAFVAQEAGFVPVAVLVRQILHDSDRR